VGAGLFVSSLRNARSFRLGYDVEPVLNAMVYTRGVRLDSTQAAAFREELLIAAQRIPGVERAAVHGGIPLNFMRANDGALRVRGMSLETTGRLPRIALDYVTTDYFAAMGTRIVQGRGFEKSDGANAPRVMILSSSLAKLLWPNGNAIGQCVNEDAGEAPCATVVGITEDTRQIAIDNPSTLFYYMPAAQKSEASRTQVLTLRMHGNAASQVEPVRKVLQAAIGSRATVEVEAFSSVVHEKTRPWRLGTTMFSVFGGLALVLASVGLYGVTAHSVVERANEIGIRMALGAHSSEVAWLFVRRTLAQLAVNVPLGLAGALATGQLLRRFLVNTPARDPLTLAAVALLLVVVALIASLLPARRAARIDPVLALRYE